MRSWSILLIRAIRAIALVAFASGCTAVKNPVVSLLSTASLFQATSPSPFEQENADGSVRFRGVCLPSTQKLQVRWEDLDWVDVPLSAPAPGTDESVPADTTYDIDCHDGAYNFYAFKSTIVDLYTARSIALPDDDPKSISIRPYGNGYVGDPVIFVRPLATKIALEVDTPNPDPWNLTIGSSNPVRLRVRLMTASGSGAKEVRTLFVRAEIVDPNSVTASTASTSSTLLTVNQCSSGFDTTCSEGSGPSFQSTTSSDEMNFAVPAPSNASYEGQFLKVTASCDVTNDPDCALVAANPVFLRLRLATDVRVDLATYGIPFPQKIAKGVAYQLGLNYQTYGGATAAVGASEFFESLLRVDGSDNQNLVQFQQGNDADCPVASTPGTPYVCRSTFAYNTLKLTVPVATSATSFRLDVVDVGMADAGSLRHDPQTRFIEIDATGSGEYRQPAVINPPDSVRKDECREIWAGPANENRTVVPLADYRNLAIAAETSPSTSDPFTAASVIYTDGFCSGSGSPSVGFSATPMLLMQRLFVKVSDSSARLKLTVTANDMDGTRTTPASVSSSVTIPISLNH